jgi:RimJ/RimL family protein N-acetyltransferase
MNKDRMIRRYTNSPADVAHVNSILNHPEVLPWLTMDDESLDFTEVLGRPDVYALFGQGGGQFYRHAGPQTYEVHSAYLPEARGKVALTTTKETLEWMFSQTDATDIITRIPRGNVAARALARACGLKHVTPDVWTVNGRTIEGDIMGLTVQAWKNQAEQ